VLINVSGGPDLTLHEVAEAAKIIHEAVDPEANIISGMVIDEGLEEAMKVTVIATGFAAGADSRTEPAAAGRAAFLDPARSDARVTLIRGGAAAEREGARDRGAADDRPAEGAADVPFYRKFIAHSRPDDPGGFGPNWSSVDDYDIPTVLRKQMD
jgi:cell division protein FtsZ